MAVIVSKVCVCVCVCERERERQRDRESTSFHQLFLHLKSINEQPDAFSLVFKLKELKSMPHFN